MNDELEVVGHFEEDDFEQVACSVWPDDENSWRVRVGFGFDDLRMGDGMEHVELGHAVLVG